MKPEYKMNVLVNISKRAQFNRTYEPLEINNLVRTYVKKTVQTKNRDPRYSKEIYRITVKQGDQYLINDNRKGYGIGTSCLKCQMEQIMINIKKNFNKYIL